MSKLVIHRIGTKSQMKCLFPEDTVYLNLKRRSFDDIKGMRFSEVVSCNGCTEEDERLAKEFLLGGG